MGFTMRRSMFLLVLVALGTICCAPTCITGEGDYHLPPAPFRHYQFNIEYLNKSVNCEEKAIVTVNGMYPGPVIYVNEGDRVIVNVTNSVHANITIHFHGIRQTKSNWMDGVGYITQCPLQYGDYFTHDFVVSQQRGTYLWHAHVNWQRATVHGAFVVYPAIGTDYPFPKPYREFPVVIGEWWYKDIEAVETAGLLSGAPFPDSDAMTINGFAGPNYNCSASEGVSILKAVPGKTYLLRIINAALNTHLFFAVANHTMTVVEADGGYVFPFEAPQILISPGQTTNVLITADQPGGSYYISVAGYGRDDVPKVRPTAIFEYSKPSPNSSFPFSPILPEVNDTGAVLTFTDALKTLYPGRVPLNVVRNLFFTVGLTNRLCLPPPLGNCTCQAPGGNCTGPLYRFQGAINNITFELPTTALLQADYYKIPGVFTDDFPDTTPLQFDFTGPVSPPPALRVSSYATRVLPIEFNSTVQLVLQDTMVLGFENHPFHLHGHNFYVLGQGFGNYDATISPLSFNLYDPPLRNTVGVPNRGWVAIRIKLNNPGLWLFHCHLDKHTSWGMETVFHVKNGIGANNSYNPPPSRLVAC